MVPDRGADHNRFLTVAVRIKADRGPTRLDEHVGLAERKAGDILTGLHITERLHSRDGTGVEWAQETDVAVRLRLKRFGRRHRPSYRVAAMDSRSPRDGRVIEELGFYDPLASDATQQVSLKKDRIAYWLRVGAQPSDTVRNLLKREGMVGQ